MHPTNRLMNYVLLALVMLPLQGCARDYSAKSIEAWVVDAETGKPVEGANVVAHWELRYGLEGGGSYQLQIMEDVTDKNGRFFFPAWGPKEIPGHLPKEARLKQLDPGIVIFKSGYETKRVWNDRPPSTFGGHGASTRTSDWNGKTIQLRKFQGNLQQYVLNIANAQSGLGIESFDTNCNWKLMPRMIVTWTREVKLLKEQKADLLFIKVDSIDDLPNQASCGSAREFFKAYE
jgi:hypothetical protein